MFYTRKVKLSRLDLKSFDWVYFSLPLIRKPINDFGTDVPGDSVISQSQSQPKQTDVHSQSTPVADPESVVTLTSGSLGEWEDTAAHRGAGRTWAQKHFTASENCGCESSSLFHQFWQFHHKRAVRLPGDSERCDCECARSSASLWQTGDPWRWTRLSASWEETWWWYHVWRWRWHDWSKDRNLYKNSVMTETARVREQQETDI